MTNGFNLVGKMLKGIGVTAAKESKAELSHKIAVETSGRCLSPKDLDGLQRAASHFLSMKLEHDWRDGRDIERAAHLLEEEGLSQDTAGQLAPQLVSAVRNAVTDIARRVCAG